MTKKIEKQLLTIAKEACVAIEERGDLERRWNDSEDFIEVPVWGIEAMLKQAYELGLKAAQGATEAAAKPAEDSLWKDGRLQIGGCTFRFWVKQYDEGSRFGINEGRISKLTIRNERTGKDVVNYDRGWDIEPKTKAAKEALDWVLRNFN